MNTIKIDNVNSWRKIYENTSFGNTFPSTYLISLLHRIIIPQMNMSNLERKCLDFACSKGANANMLRLLGFDVYGVDISDKAIEHCVKQLGFDSRKFRNINVLKETKEFISWIGENSLDLIVFSEACYYFSDKDREELLVLLGRILKPNGILYINNVTFNQDSYRLFSDSDKDENGLITIPTTGSVKSSLKVRLVNSVEEVSDWCLKAGFEVIFKSETNEPIEGDNIEAHVIASKS